MADYHETTAPASGGGVGTPALCVRADHPGNGANARSAANNKMVMPLLDSSDVLRVNGEGCLPTYSAVIKGLVPVSSATNIFTLTGSANCIAKVRRVEIAGTATAASTVDLSVFMQSAADTGGTATQPTIVPHDSTDAAANCVVNAYTANPTVGTQIGAIRTTKLTCVAPNSVPDSVGWDFVRSGAKPPELRSASQVFALHLNAGTVGSGGSLDIYIEWTEEPITA